MSVSTALYTLLIGPLELFFEIVFMLANRVLQNPGLSIILLSLVVNFLVLPLYNRADEMQAAEREVEKRMEPGVRHIKKTFKGDEQFMMLQTYYRQNGYKPTDVLKGSVSLLLQVPFFIAAYNFLSGLQLLQGVSFGPIRDMGVPDAMFTVGGFSVNVLPILMTALNIISGIIYTKGFPLKEKVQLYGMALIFLVLLYTSPAGLVFYWTLNNLFSLLKNIFVKMKNPKLVLSVIFSLAGLGLMGWALKAKPLPDTRGQVLLLLTLALLQLPLLGRLAGRFMPTVNNEPVTRQEDRLCTGASALLTALLGLLIPLSVVRTSPEEFLNTVTMTSPLTYVLAAFLMAAGVFLVWLRIFYALGTPAGKRIMGLVLWLLCGVSLVDYLFFGKEYGTLDPRLRFLAEPDFPAGEVVLNLLVLAVVLAVLVLVWKKRQAAARLVCGCLLLGMAVMSVVDGVNVSAVARETLVKMGQSTPGPITLPLSREGKNVMVLMMDRAISSYLPYMMAEKPELQRQFAGFTYYPNTVSFGPFTNTGSPALFGGYEYTPEEMNKRADERLEDKHDEALKVMPVLFSENGFEVTVVDPTYAGYDWIPDLSIYDDYPEIRRFNTVGRFDDLTQEEALYLDKTLSRNFFCYSLFKTAPVFLQPTLYNDGVYNEANAVPLKADTDGVQGQFQCTGMSNAIGQMDTFPPAYAALENFASLTQVEEGQKNTFLMLSNSTPHEPTLLQEPDYVPVPRVDNMEYDAAHWDRFTLDGRTMVMNNSYQMRHYHVNMATMLHLGRWMDLLREEGVYDNTRIIIAADHGRDLGNFPEMIVAGEGSENRGHNKGDAMFYNPLLMVKDFGASEFATDMTFMTNADVPTLAFAGLVDEPVNPFTGKPINSEDKNKPEQHIFATVKWSTQENGGNTYLPDNWLAVHDNIFDKNNWRELGVH